MVEKHSYLAKKAQDLAKWRKEMRFRDARNYVCKHDAFFAKMNQVPLDVRAGLLTGEWKIVKHPPLKRSLKSRIKAFFLTPFN